MSVGSNQPVAFGPFVVDLRTGELRKGPTRIRLQDLPFRVLAILLEQPGDTVSRQQLQSRLWAQEGTFVDFDHSLNTSVSKLRAALSDRASRPRYIETVGRHGYRFIGQITASAANIPAAGAANTDHHSEQLPSIAVLPLANLTADPQNDYFTDGLTGEFINALAAIPGLRVVARTSSFQFRNASEDVREIGARLGVRFVLEGSVRRVGDRVRVAVQLIKVSDGYHALSRMYDRKVDDILDLQERLASEVAHELAPHLDHSNAARGRTRNPEAYSAYLQGRHHLVQNRVDGPTGAAAYFEQAIRLDPHFAAAHSGLADALLGQVFFGIVGPATVMEKARAAAEEALRLDPSLGEAHVSMALVEIGLEHAWDSSFQRLEIATRTLLPSNPFAAVVFGYWGLARRGESERALQLLDTALRVDPFNPQVHASIILNLGLLGRYAEAMEHYRLTTTRFTTNYFVHRTMAEIHHRESEHERALETLLCAGRPEELEAVHESLGDFGFAYAVTGRHRDADAIAARIESRAKVAYVSPWNRALIWSGRKQPAETVAALRQVVQEKSLKVGAFPIDPRLSWLRGHAEFEFLLREVGLAGK